MSPWMLLFIGIGLDVLGTIWVLQGINVLPGSFMTGQPFWAGAGLVMTVLGMVVLVVAIRRRAEEG